MNFGGRDKSSDATTAFDHAFAFQGSQGVAGGHQADFVELSQVALGADRIAGAQVAGVNPFAPPAKMKKSKT